MVQLFKPHSFLKPFVSSFLVKTASFESTVNLVISARGIPMLIFPFKAPPVTTYTHGLSGAKYPDTHMKSPALLTACNEFTNCSFLGEINFVMVMLQPTTAYHFLQSNVSGLSNSIIMLEDLGSKACFDDLQDKLWHCDNATKAVDEIQRTLMFYFEQKAKIGLGDLSPVFSYMLSQPDLLTVQALRKKFKCSERWLEKQFAQQTSLSPKAWLRLIRFRTVANYWLLNSHESWMHIVAKFDYTDQSHLIKDFKQFTGNPPAYHFENFKNVEIDFKQNKAGLSEMIK